MNRKKILFIGDDFTLYSGIASISREIILGTSDKFDWVQLGAAINHPKNGERIDMSSWVNDKTGRDNSNVILYPNNGYGNSKQIKQLIKVEKPDILLIFGDPRYYQWLFNIESEIRKEIPIAWLNIWDSLPSCLYNLPFYSSCDALFGITKQTVNINKNVLGEETENKVIKFIPHGRNPEIFKPILNKELLNKTKRKYFNSEPEFIVLFNSRNIRRKNPSDLMVAWKLFQDTLSKHEKLNTALLYHTDVIDGNGTDLYAVREMLFGENSTVYFTEGKLSDEDINLLYNIADLTCLPSSNEGFGLSLNESLLTGTMICANVTGGMIDQMRFEDENGKWIEYDNKFMSNQFGTYKKTGVWAKPVFPKCHSLLGSPETPYIWDDHLDFRDLYKSIEEVYRLDPEERKSNGLEGMKWVLGDESMMNSQHMCSNIIEGIEETLEKFIPKKSFSLTKIQKLKPKQITHPILY